MYEAHFGLLRRPFGETISPSAFVALPCHEAVLRRLRYAIEHGQGPAVLFGPPGSGKTILARRLADTWPGQAVHITFPALPPADLVAHIAAELGIPSPAPTSVHLSLRQLRDRLGTSAARGRRPLLIVDEAHLIDDASTFETLKLLLNFATEGPPDLAMLLVGGAELLLDLPPGMADRLTARCLLGPLTEADASAYVLGRLEAAGSRSLLFSPRALTALYRAADGLPRRMNRLADLALLIAYAQDLAIVEETTVAIADRDFNHGLSAA